MNTKPKSTACITGATSGIGRAFATYFAREGYDLLISGRRKEKLDHLAGSLKKEHGVDVEVILAELSVDDDLETLVQKIKSLEHIEVLVNNAGYAVKGLFHELDFGEHEKMLNVHDLALIRLCYAAIPSMLKQQKGSIINVSSISAFTPFPKNAMYSATKAFVKNFSESLALELKGTGVKVQALCPGMTRTEFHERMGYEAEKVYKNKGLMKAMTPEKVVHCSIKCLQKDKVICVPGGNNKYIRALLKHLPDKAVQKLASRAMKQ